MSQIESTYKARDVEETIDMYFYRPLGYYVARACSTAGITPNAVTILSIVIGVGAGHLFYYRDLALNGWGILLWVVADILDSSDGQLARMTNNKSELGRILDGFAGNIIFVSIYLHLFARMVDAGSPVWVFLLVLSAGVSHSLQSALADYYRNAYLTFVVDPAKAELARSRDIRAEYEKVRFGEHPFRKFLLRVYLNYTVEQEAFTRNFQALRDRVEALYGMAALPAWFRREYERRNKPLLKYYAIMTTNTRVLILAVAVLADMPVLYFLAEVVAINLVMIGVTLYQERLSKQMLDDIHTQEGAL